MKLYPKDVKKVRAKLSRELQRIGGDFRHMLQHISEIEERVMEEMKYEQLRLAMAPDHPQIVSLSKPKGRRDS